MTEIPITIDDVRLFNLHEILTEVGSKTCHAYETVFTQKAKLFAEDGNKKSQTICELFAAFSSFHLRLDNPNEPYEPEWIFYGDRRSVIPRDIQEPYLKILLEFVRDIADAELRARIADVLWVLRKGDYKIAQLAIDAYLESAIILENPEKWTEGAMRIERALQLAAQLGRSTTYFLKTIEHIEQLLARLDASDPLWFSHKLMSLLFKYRQGDPIKYANLSEKTALVAETTRYWRRARDYWDLSGQWHDRNNDVEKGYTARLHAAETFIHEADDYIRLPKPNYRNAGHEIVLAVEALRRINAPQSKIQEIHARLLEYQEKDEDFQEYSYSIDLSKYATASQEAVKAKSLREAILILASICSIPDFNELREDIVGEQKQSPLYFWFATQQLNERGRVTATRPGISSYDEENAELAIRAEMYRHAVMRQEINAQGLILPAINQINIDHQICLDDLAEFVKNNPFVPPGYEFIFLRGLYYGLIGDFMAAAHLLLPQIENSIRYLLNQRKVITTKLDAQGIQDERDLGGLLEMPETEQIFGQNLLFDLQGLLVRRFGSNLRNLFAHGLMSADHFSSLRIVYFWWIVLFLCCVPLLTDTPTQQVDD